MLWRCKSRLYCGQECKYSCEIKADADFVPTCCVGGSGYQEWEKDPLEATAERAKSGEQKDLHEYLEARKKYL